ncbi:TetR/AcrR family transcriptional regulator [Streptomyces sp. NPDC056296]|uniref:TetR/AcrR family transcriptional regulator n=1 Tax=Streptomyces sp. NPDC056296 TaxID=3345775 RepID=UPI0035DCC15E
MSTKRRIVQAATRLFAEKGYLGTGVRDIEDAVGIRRGALYYHIGNKENLLFEIAHGQIASMNARVAEIAETDVRPEEKLRAVAHLLIQAIVDNQLATTVFFRDWIWLGDEKREEILAIRDAFEDQVARIIAEGVDAGVWVDRGPLVVKGVLGMLNHTYMWFRPQGSVSADELADTYVDILVHGLGPGPASAEE